MRSAWKVSTWLGIAPPEAAARTRLRRRSAARRTPSAGRSPQSLTPYPAAPSPVTAFPGPLGSAPVRRGAAVVAITGGALSMMGAASPVATPDPATGPDVAPASSVSTLPEQAGQDVLLRSSVLPVAPDPDVLDDPSPLVKAIQMAEEQIARAEAERAAAEERARAEAEQAEAEAAAAAAEAQEEAESTPARRSSSADCGIDTGSLGAVRDYVREAAEFLGCLYGEPTMIGVAGRSGTSDHPSGRAIDFMVDRSTGDALADCALRNMDSLGISYVIWKQRINHGSGWEGMEDRGGVTANHFDHVHISFDSAGSGGLGGC